MNDQELFRPNQGVVWSNHKIVTQQGMAARFGSGAFTVLSVEEIPPDACTCGGSFWEESHRFGCPYDDVHHGRYGKRVRQAFGHSQFVTIDDGTGKPQTFSGLYFTAA